MRGSVVRWLWTTTGMASGGARLSLLPIAIAYGWGMRARAVWGAHRAQRLPPLPIPTVAVGSLLVGGAGKTPVASWLAGALRDRNLRPGIVLRPYGGDEAVVHRMLQPTVPVVEAKDRRRGVHELSRLGCRVAVLDDAYQRTDLTPDLTVALVPADAQDLPRWVHPAGPWREVRAGLRRADLVIVTRKQASGAVAARLAGDVRRRWPTKPVARAHLSMGGLRRMTDGGVVPPGSLDGRSVLVCAGVADPRPLVADCQRLGARTELLAWPDHHRYRAADLTRLLQIAARVDYVVVTEKDAVKLRGVWPDGRESPLVAALEVEWEAGEALVSALLQRLATGHQRMRMSG
ncbi:MAG TPA: tetraacyldisaccharide 4'-kinase [Gemmatimonadales bacterium]